MPTHIYANIHYAIYLSITFSTLCLCWGQSVSYWRQSRACQCLHFYLTGPISGAHLYSFANFQASKTPCAPNRQFSGSCHLFGPPSDSPSFPSTHQSSSPSTVCGKTAPTTIASSPVWSARPIKSSVRCLCGAADGTHVSDFPSFLCPFSFLLQIWSYLRRPS